MHSAIPQVSGVAPDPVLPVGGAMQRVHRVLQVVEVGEVVEGVAEDLPWRALSHSIWSCDLHACAEEGKQVFRSFPLALALPSCSLPQTQAQLVLSQVEPIHIGHYK